MSRYADELEALSNAATVGQWRHVGRKGFDLDHTIITVEGQVVATLGDAIYHDSPNADLIVSLVNHADDFVRLLRAAEETREQLLRDFAIKCRCDFVTKLSAGIERCVGCRARDRIAAIDSALAPFEEE